jgi:hypothetical protein
MQNQPTLEKSYFSIPASFNLDSGEVASILLLHFETIEEIVADTVGSCQKFCTSFVFTENSEYHPDYIIHTNIQTGQSIVLLSVEHDFLS